MRILKTFALAALVLFLAAALSPAQAFCTGPAVIQTNTAEGRTFVWNEAVFAPTCLADYPPYMYSEEFRSPVSTDFFGAFWQFGLGNTSTTPLLGTDSGTWEALDWANSTVTGSGWFQFYAWDAATGFGTYAAEIFADWSANQLIDGCIAANVCECVLMTDQVGGVGYFAIASGLTSGTADLSLTQPGTNCTGVGDGLIILKPVPEPQITRIDMDMATHNMTFNVTAAAPAEGVYNKDGCNCGPTGFVVYQAVVGRDAPPPGDRNGNAAPWEPMTPVTAFGAPAVFLSECGSTEVDVYLAIGLAFDSGFPAGGAYPVHLSANSMKTQCGPTMAEPKPLTPRIRRQERENPRLDRTR